MAEMGLAAAMSGGMNMYGNGDGNTVKHYYDKQQYNKKGSNMACKTKKPGKKIMSNSGIEIMKSHKGRFTRYCENKGHEGVTSECIKECLASNMAATRKQA